MIYAPFYVNSNDDNGLISGNWGTVTEGTKPTEWVNMRDIYREYLQELVPVRWGQCFVFSALVTSICRDLGILCRSVTGFSIGHDNNGDGILTIYLDEMTMEIIKRNSETLWYTRQ
ncbi:Annulin [Thelohanellus kitauei]|uniref:Annulin n=1 Tax=Thelohanellus kitauei TaxID=669202 RepID=A0A0C2J3K6_THEKT|nr:Annulin [Thelohanellus kitauei]